MKYIGIILLLAFSSQAMASFYCGGKVNNVYVSKTDGLVIRGDWRNDYTQLCSLDGSFKGVSAITCSMWASYAATALKDKKKVLLSYADVEGVNCSNLPTYGGSPSPNYFMLTHEDVN